MAQLMLNYPLRFTLMKSKIITAIGATSLVFGMFALSGCYETSYPDYGGGYGYSGYGPGYYSQPVVVEQRSWHWWGHHDSDDNHRYESRSHSEHEERANRDRDHDHDHD